MASNNTIDVLSAKVYDIIKNYNLSYTRIDIKRLIEKYIQYDVNIEEINDEFCTKIVNGLLNSQIADDATSSTAVSQDEYHEATRTDVLAEQQQQEQLQQQHFDNINTPMSQESCYSQVSSNFCIIDNIQQQQQQQELQSPQIFEGTYKKVVNLEIPETIPINNEKQQQQETEKETEEQVYLISYDQFPQQQNKEQSFLYQLSFQENQFHEEQQQQQQQQQQQHILLSADYEDVSTDHYTDAAIINALDQIISNDDINNQQEQQQFEFDEDLLNTGYVTTITTTQNSNVDNKNSTINLNDLNNIVSDGINKRKRGRPRKNDKKETENVRRKPGRPPKLKDEKKTVTTVKRPRGRPPKRKIENTSDTTTVTTIGTGSNYPSREYLSTTTDDDEEEKEVKQHKYNDNMVCDNLCLCLLFILIK